MQLTADTAVKWSLLPGSAGTIDAGGTYHAPAAIKSPHAMGGCQIGAPDSVFNTRVDNLPLHPNNTAWMAILPAQGIGISPAWGVNIADNKTPSQAMVFAYNPTYNGQLFQIPAWPALKRENGVFSDPLTDVDRHILTVNHETCQAYDIYNNYPAGTAGNQAPESAYNAQGGWQYNTMSYALPTGGASDAAGLALAPTTLTLDDIRSGAVRHALRVTFGNAFIARQFVWPATSNAGAWGTVPYGTRFRMKAGVDISAFSPTAQIILTGLKKYGMIISDGGSNWDIVAATDLTEDRAVEAAVVEIGFKHELINSSSFEIVDESSLMVDPYSSRVAYNNPYVTPDAFAIAKADDGVHPPVLVPIALQGVALNAPEGGGVWIQSGVTKALNVLVGGTSTTAVTWKMSPVLGTLDPASGVYVAPPVNAPATTSITATSVADPTVSVTFPLTVMPAGAIRIMPGDTTANPAAPNAFAPDYGADSDGNMWWHDQGSERGWGVRNDYWYGLNYGVPAPWAAAKDIYRYQTQAYNTADTVYRFVVPNGNYNIDYYDAQGDCDITNTKNPMWYRHHLEAQGQIAAYDFRPLAITGGKCYTPVHTTIPAKVTDNNLYFALRRITDHTQTGYAQFPVTTISSFSITPTLDSAHLSIDPAAPPALSAAQTVQLHAVGWFMSNQVTWSIQSGPGTVDVNGLYTAPSTPLPGTAVVRATSISDPSQTATVQINLVFGAMAISPGSVTLNRSATQQLSATVAGQPYANVSWSLSPAVGSITSTGLYTAPDVLTADTVVTVQAVSKDDATKSATASLTITANAAPIRINASDGDISFTDAQGNFWSKDYGYSDGSGSYDVIYDSSVVVGGTTSDMLPLYKSSRYVYSNETLQYNLPLPNGWYQVTLKFCDWAATTPGTYNFDVQINGTTVESNFDPDALYPTTPHHAVDRSYSIYVANKNLNLSFIGHQGGALVNGIQVLPIAGGTTTASVTLSGLSATYSGTAKPVTVTTSPANLPVVITYNGSTTVPVAAGSYAVTATVNQTGYTGSTSGTLVIAKATPVITWKTPSSIIYGTTLSSTQLNATSGVAGSFAYTPTAGTVLPVGTGQILSTTFTPADTRDYNSATATVLIDVTAASSVGGNNGKSPQISVTQTLSRNASSNIVVVLTFVNTGRVTDTNVTVTGLKIGTVSGSPLPVAAGNIDPGKWASVTLTVPGSAGLSGSTGTLTLTGTYAGKNLNYSASVILP